MADNRLKPAPQRPIDQTSKCPKLADPRNAEPADHRPSPSWPEIPGRTLSGHPSLPKADIHHPPLDAA